jgi:tripartite-type tricarboxylate transporter receptor subunit TctC
MLSRLLPQCVPSLLPRQIMRSRVLATEAEEQAMVPLKSRLIGAALFVATSLCPLTPLQAEEWPVKPVRIVVPFTAGGQADRIARLLVDELSKIFKQQFYIENRAGAGGATGGLQVARAKPDGYTLLLGNYGTNMMTPIQNSKVGYHPIDDFTNIGMIAGEASLVVVNQEAKVKTFAEFADWARRQPHPVNVGTSGRGTVSELIFEQLRRHPKLQLNVAPIGAAAVTTLSNMLGNHIPAGSMTVSALLQYVEGGKLVPLAIASRERAPALKDVPTLAELGYPEVDNVIWTYIAAPKGLPELIVNRLNLEIRKIVKLPGVAKALDQSAYFTMDVDVATLNAFLVQDHKAWTTKFESVGLTGN